MPKLALFLGDNLTQMEEIRSCDNNPTSKKNIDRYKMIQEKNKVIKYEFYCIK